MDDQRVVETVVEMTAEELNQVGGGAINPAICPYIMSE